MAFAIMTHLRITLQASKTMIRLTVSTLFTTLFLASSAGSALADTVPVAPAIVQAANVDAARLNAAGKDDANWMTYGRTYDEQRYSPLKDINDKSVSKLGLAWYFDTDYDRGLEGTPLVVDGVMYSTGNWNMVYANNAATGELLWKYDPHVDKSRAVYACCDVVSRGIAVWEGKVFSATLDGYLIAIDANTGKEVWRTLTFDQSKPYTITGAPHVIKGKVIIGNGGAEYGVRGYVTAYDADTGKQVWRFWTVPSPGDVTHPENKAMEMAAKTWSGDKWQEYGGGGTVWDAMAYDPELNQLYIGVGNAGPWNRQLRNPQGLDNLFVGSIVSLNPDTGEYIWHYQETPNDGWDYTSTQHIMLLDIEWNGKMRKLLMQAPKNGFFFVLDRETGEFLSAKKYANVNWALDYDAKGRPIENPKKDYRSGTKQMIRPAPTGAHNWQPMAYNAQTGLIYIPLIDGMFEYNPDNQYQKKTGVWNVGMQPMESPPGDAQFQEVMSHEVMRGGVEAWDPKQQKVVWSFWLPDMWNGGMLSTAGNLLFQGNAEQQLVAYRADNGEKLWSAPTQSGVIAPPITYTVNGEQYVAVMAGWGGAFGLAGGLKPPLSARYGRILAFKLKGNAQLPPLPPPLVKYDPPPRMNVSKEVIAEGQKIYNSYCMGCHGMGLVSMDSVPDLRFIPEAFHQSFNDIVLRGVLKDHGMVSFAQVINEQQADALHAYILDGANTEKERLANPDSPWWHDTKQWIYTQFGKFIRTVM
jgi:quinohemoprotein ethanol dehydrogenase